MRGRCLDVEYKEDETEEVTDWSDPLRSVLRWEAPLKWRAVQLRTSSIIDSLFWNWIKLSLQFEPGMQTISNLINAQNSFCCYKSLMITELFSPENYFSKISALNIDSADFGNFCLCSVCNAESIRSLLRSSHLQIPTQTCALNTYDQSAQSSCFTSHLEISPTAWELYITAFPASVSIRWLDCWLVCWYSEYHDLSIKWQPIWGGSLQ